MPARRPAGRPNRLLWIVIVAGLVGAYIYSTRTRPSAVAWEYDLDAAMKRASEDNQLLLIEFFATWCGPCKTMDQHVFARQDVAEALDDWVTVKVDGDQNGQLAARYGVTGYPTFYVITPHRQMIAHTTGALPAESFIDWIKAIEEKWEKTAPPESTGHPW